MTHERAARPIRTLLVANRGEIACRIVRTCRALGITSVAVYSDADRNALHTRLADRAIHIGASESLASYLDIDAVLAAAQRAGADAIHPGYGFLSENAEFAQRVEAAGMRFIGPPADTIRLLGDKLSAKQLAAQQQVPLLPSLAVECDALGVVRNSEALESFVAQTGFPLIVKAAGGGGGRGMRKVFRPEELQEALRGASHEATSSFKDPRVYLERLIEHPRHIEVQILGDGDGDAVALLDRDCTLQRMHQKVIEEAPAPGLSDELRHALHAAAIRLCGAARYRGAGTVEFLLDRDGQFYFMEVNSRLQVEHPVTEAILGLDLVAAQIAISEGRGIPSEARGATLQSARGVAIEARVCAEVPERNFAAATGVLRAWQMGEGVRVDTGYEAGSVVTHYYDSLLAKVVSHGTSREAARASLVRALRESVIAGVRTNIGFLLTLLTSDEFRTLTHSTSSAAALRERLPSNPEAFAPYFAAALLARSISEVSALEAPSPWNEANAWRLAGPALERETFTLVDLAVDTVQVELVRWGAARATIKLRWSDEAHSEVQLDKIQVRAVEPTTRDASRSPAPTASGVGVAIGEVSFNMGEGPSHWTLKVVRCDDQMWVAGPYGIVPLRPYEAAGRTRDTNSNSPQVTAPLPGKVVRLLVSAGAPVEEATPLLVLESMKMEHQITAGRSATIEKVLVREGDVVESGNVLVTFASVST